METHACSPCNITFSAAVSFCSCYSLPILSLHSCHSLSLNISVSSLELKLLFLPSLLSFLAPHHRAAEPIRLSRLEILTNLWGKKWWEHSGQASLVFSIVSKHFSCAQLPPSNVTFHQGYTLLLLLSVTTEWAILISDGIFSSRFLFCFCLLMLWNAVLFSFLCQCLALFEKWNCASFSPLGHACWYSDWT